jgi:hypothetical protein
LSSAPQGSDWMNLPGTAQFLSTQTDTTMFALIWLPWPPCPALPCPALPLPCHVCHHRQTDK